ncbi:MULTISPECIES: ABC transporter ATP-binding protein [Brevibacillus]|uniref:ABC transporter ATP-binding protein n=1 Tax=Brevibacillus TaxID=55080 RepID=UPI000F0A0B5D|nr:MULTISPECIES: ABC transporter ATP-binding protein [Brevibacillus]MDR7314610.1 branched-chain amino acid transport system ATP-binding protein [Brevibacillus nitrificans]MEC2129680.1 ABC transporter ATP-binding protein [Brevibacillus centrosporus]RNB67136.1 ABC transporter ATP-binding protein [Brevibacillus centrosporus]GED33552.1 ABC transporter ATP-binding protein [Brevibacillus centrosporus]
MSALLKLTDVHSFYGKIEALKGISLEVRQGEIVALLGSNGAGKSTTLKTISGLVRPGSGDIQLEGKSLVGWSPHRIVEEGIVHVPEGRRIFAGLTVHENLELGGFTQRKEKAVIAEGIELAYALFPRLKERSRQLGGTLSGGEQQMLAICRGLMARPKLLMLDEPSMGLAPIIVQEIMEIIRKINGQGTTILLIEQNAKAALRLAHRGYVLETGQIVMENTAEVLRGDESIVKAYLGA